MRLWLNGSEAGGLQALHIKTTTAMSPNLADADKFLLRFLRAQKFDVKKGQQMLRRYLLLRAEKPEWFANLDLNHHHQDEEAVEHDSGLLELLRQGFLQTGWGQMLFNH